MKQLLRGTLGVRWVLGKQVEHEIGVAPVALNKNEIMK